MTDMRIMHLITRGILTAKNAARKLRTIQCELFGGDVRDNVEDFEPYGLTCEPMPGAEVLAVSIGGDREHTICICHPDRRCRPTGLQDGEVCLYDWKGRKVFLSASGIQVDGVSDPVTVKTSASVEIDAPTVHCSGNLNVDGTITAKGTINDLSGNGGSSMDAMRAVFNTHTHNHGSQPDQQM